MYIYLYLYINIFIIILYKKKKQLTTEKNSRGLAGCHFFCQNLHQITIFQITKHFFYILFYFIFLFPFSNLFLSMGYQWSFFFSFFFPVTLSLSTSPHRTSLFRRPSPPTKESWRSPELGLSDLALKWRETPSDSSLAQRESRDLACSNAAVWAAAPQRCLPSSSALLRTTPLGPICSFSGVSDFI